MFPPIQKEYLDLLEAWMSYHEGGIARKLALVSGDMHFAAATDLYK